MTRSTKKSRRAEPQRSRLWQVIAASAAALAFAVTAVVATLPRTDTAIVTLPTKNADVVAIRIDGPPASVLEPQSSLSGLQAAVYYPATWEQEPRPVVVLDSATGPDFRNAELGRVAEGLVDAGFVVLATGHETLEGDLAAGPSASTTGDALEMLFVANTEKEELLGQELTGHLDLGSVAVVPYPDAMSGTIECAGAREGARNTGCSIDDLRALLGGLLGGSQ